MKNPDHNSKVNMKTVAKKAKVSIATVSRVLNDLPNISEKTRKKVLNAVNDLDYEINAVASDLRRKSTKTIGIIVGNILSQFHSIVAKAVEDTANKFGYNVILCNSDDNPEKELEYLKVLKSKRVDGVLLISREGNIRYINKMINSGIKIVLLDRLIDGLECDAVIVDNENGAYSAVKHLITEGYKKIGIICGPLNIFTDKERLNGYLRALNEAGIKEDKNLIKIEGLKKEDGVKQAKEFLEASERPEAIFTANLDLTLGAVIALKKMGIKIPDEIGIIGFDDIECFLLMDPPLSTVNQPIYSLGATAADLLIKRIKGEDKSFGDKPHVITLKTKLILRESTKKQS